MAINKVFLIGNIGQDPVVRDAAGTKVTNFTLATTEKGYIKKDGTQVPDKTEWHDIVAWRGLAEVIAKYGLKGTKVFVEGKLTHRKADVGGTTRYYTEVVADNIELLARPNKEQGNPNPIQAQQPTPASGPAPAPTAFDEPDDELPF